MLSLTCACACGAVVADAPSKRALRFRASTPQEAREWQREAREKLFALLMGGRQPAKVPLDPQVISRVEPKFPSYVLTEFSFQSLPGRRVHGWMATPTKPKGKVGGVLAIHGHGGPGKRVVEGDNGYWYGRHLAEMGYVVVAPDIGKHDPPHDNWTMMGEWVWDCLCAVDYLAGQPEVDPKRLAVIGISLGGELTMYTAALDERLKLADSSGWLCTVENMKLGHCNCWTYPGLEESFDYPDIFACIAPRYLICENGEQEPERGGFPVATAKKAFAEIREAYKVFGAPDRLQHDIHPGGHIPGGKLFFPWCYKVLGEPK